MAKIAHTHTQTAFMDYFFRTPYMCFPHTYHPFLLPTKKNTIYANWYIYMLQTANQKISEKTTYIRGKFCWLFRKKTPAKRLRLTFHTTIRTERFGECGARPWGSPMCGEGCQWLDLLLQEHSIYTALQFFPARETLRFEGRPFSKGDPA